jgi:hypothetical protein
MESGAKAINSRRLKAVANALGVSESDLFIEDADQANRLAELVAIARSASAEDLDQILGVARLTSRK